MCSACARSCRSSGSLSDELDSVKESGPGGSTPATVIVSFAGLAEIEGLGAPAFPDECATASGFALSNSCLASSEVDRFSESRWRGDSGQAS